VFWTRNVFWTVVYGNLNQLAAAILDFPFLLLSFYFSSRVFFRLLLHPTSNRKQQQQGGKNYNNNNNFSKAKCAQKQDCWGWCLVSTHSQWMKVDERWKWMNEYFLLPLYLWFWALVILWNKPKWTCCKVLVPRLLSRHILRGQIPLAQA
jgi:hypothetical protein